MRFNAGLVGCDLSHLVACANMEEYVLACFCRDVGSSCFKESKRGGDVLAVVEGRTFDGR